MKNLLCLLFIFITATAFSQKGIVSGHIKEKSGEDAIGANILLEGTTSGAATGIDGKFSFQADSGEYKLIVTSIGFQKLIVENFEVKANEEVSIELQLEPENQQLDEIVIRAEADRSSESFLTIERKTAVQFVQSIGSVELSRKGISNAETAVAQVTGVSKQEGVKNVFVRGLGDRYNSTSLNGLPLPSEDPQFKNITLDFFGTDIINNIEVNKTFNPTLFGDVGGANIDISSKELQEDRELKISVSSGLNFQTADKTFYVSDGTNFFGTSNKDIPVKNLSNYTFGNSFKLSKGATPINSGLTLSTGRKFNVGGNTLRAFFVASMNSSYQFKNDFKRQVTSTGNERQRLKGEKFEYNANQMAMLNLAYDFSKSNTVKFNSLLIHDNKQYVANYEGFIQNINDNYEDPNAYKSFLRRQQQNDNYLLVNQLLASFNINDRLTLDLAGAYNRVTGSEPDRRTNSYGFDGENYFSNSSSPAFSNRFFSSLVENDLIGKADVTYNILGAVKGKVIVGYNFRHTKRNFEATQFNFDFPNVVAIDINNPESVFNQNELENGTFEMQTGRGTAANALKPFTYTGMRNIHAGYVNGSFDLTSKLSVNAGIRFEALTQEVTWDTNLDEARPGVQNDNIVTIKPTYFLPSLSVKYKVTENDNIRLAASQSYTSPQFKELAKFLYEDVNSNSFGNEYLKNAENINADLGFEHYFDATQFIAITGFYKNIDKTINMIQAVSAAREYSYVNTGTSQVLGVELEIKKRLFKKSDSAGETSLDFGTSVSYLYGTQQLLEVKWDKVVFQPYDDRKKDRLEGATPLIINADLTFKKERSEGKLFMAAIIFTSDMDRIAALGYDEINNTIMSGIPKMNFISKYDINRHLSAGLNLRNLLNPEFKETQGLVTDENALISSYKKGVSGSISISYRFY